MKPLFLSGKKKVCGNRRTPFLFSAQRRGNVSDPQTPPSKQLAASAQLNSLMGTAKANGREPYVYLRHILKRLPLATSVTDCSPGIAPPRFKPNAWPGKGGVWSDFT